MSQDTKLTVSLILNDASFSKQIQSVNKDLKLTQSEFTKTASSTDNFENSMLGLQAKLASVASQLSTQSQKVALYGTEISKTKTLLADLTTKHSEEALKLTTLKQKYEETAATMGKNSKEAQALKTEITELEKSQAGLENKILSTDSRLKTLNTSLNVAQTEFNKFDKEIKDTEKTISTFNVDKMTKQIDEATAKMKSHGDKLQSFGRGMKDTGQAINMNLSLPLAAAGTWAVKTGISFEKSMSYIKATADVSGKELDTLSKKAREMGASTSKSATDAADAMGYMALAGWNTQEMLQGIEPILRLAEAGQFDLATASNLVTNSMAGLKLQVKDIPGYLDQVTKAANITNTDIQPLIEALNNVGATAKVVGMPIEELNAHLGVLANSNIDGYEAGTKLNSILTRITAQSKPAIAAWKNIGVEVFDSQGKFRGLTNVLEEARVGFQNFSDQEKMTFLKKAIGTDNVAAFSIMIDAAGGKVQDLTKKIKDSDGTLMKMAKTMQDNTQGNIYEFQSRIEELALKFDEVLLPIVNKAIVKLMALIDKFDKMSPTTKKLIVDFGLFTIAGGLLTTMLGNLCIAGGGILKAGSRIGGWIAGLGKASAAAAPIVEATAGALAGVEAGAAGAGAAVAGAEVATGGFAAALGAGALAALPWIAGAVAIGAAGYGVYKVMTEEAVPAIDLFADKVEYSSKAAGTAGTYASQQYEASVTKISDATKTAVGEYIKLDDSVSSTLNHLYVTSEKITTDTATGLVTKYQEMNSQIKAGNDKHYGDQIATMQTFFTDSHALTETEEQQAILRIQDANARKQTENAVYVDKIKAILDKASAEKRELFTDEARAIGEIQDKMKNNAINALSENEVQAKIILERIKDYGTRITSEQASEEIKNAVKAKEETVKAAQEKYVRTVATIEKMRDESHSITADQAEKLIADAEKQKQGSIDKAEELRKGVVSKIEVMNRDVSEDVDTTTGNIMTRWDKVCRWWNGLWFKKQKMETDVVENQITTRSFRDGGNTAVQLDGFVEPQSLGVRSFTDGLEVPNASSYANETVSAISVSKNKQGSNDDIVSVMSTTLHETKKQNDLLMKLVILMQEEKNVDVNLNVDGKNFAKATAKYMKNEIDNIGLRKSRLGGAY